MTNKQSAELFGYMRAKKLLSIHSQRSAPSKRSSKSNGRGVGQVLKSSRVESLEYYDHELSHVRPVKKRILAQ